MPETGLDHPALSTWTGAAKTVLAAVRATSKISLRFILCAPNVAAYGPARHTTATITSTVFLIWLLLPADVVCQRRAFVPCALSAVVRHLPVLTLCLAQLALLLFDMGSNILFR